MNRLQEIEARLTAIASEVETRAAELNAEAITALESEVEALKEERKTLKDTAERRTQLLTSIANGTAPKATVVRSFAADTVADADRFDTPEYRKAFMNYALSGTEIPAEQRANATSKTADVGAVIPTTVLNQIVEKLEATGMILPLVTRTAYKGGVSIPVSTAKPVATWVNEGATSDKQKKTIDKNGMITFAYHKLRCAVAVSLEVDNMAMSAFEALLINNIVEAMTKAIEQSIIDGTGVGQPKGILKETPPTGQEIKVTAVGYDDLIAAEAALPQAYENGAVWCMSKKTFMQYYGLKDVNGNPIGREVRGVTTGKPERTLLGRTVVCCDYVSSFDASVAVGTKFGFLFNFKDYVLNTNYNMGVKKYEDNETDDMVTKAIMLVDGKAIDLNSLVVLAKKA